MAEVVGLDGKRVDGEVPRDDRPEDVLEKLLGQIRDGSAKVTKLMIIVEGTIGESANHYFTRTSLATNSEAVALTVIGQRIIVDGVLDI